MVRFNQFHGGALELIERVRAKVEVKGNVEMKGYDGAIHSSHDDLHDFLLQFLQ